MSRLPKSLHLEYNLTKPLQTRYSIIGITTMACAMVGVILGTLWTKGLIPSTDVEYLPNSTYPGYRCNSTLIYPGQLFGSESANTSFRYQSLSQFAYNGQPLQSCSLKDAMSIDVVGPPMQFPRVAINQTVTCYRLDPIKQTRVAVNFAVSELLFWGYTTGGSAQLGWKYIDFLSQLANNQFSWSSICGYVTVVAFRIDGYEQNLKMFHANDTGNYPCGLQLSATPQATRIINITQDAILYDWESKLKSLPELLYPCVLRDKVWAPFWTILLEVLTAMFAFFSPLLAVLLLLLQRLQERATKRDTDEEHALRPSFPQSSSSISAAKDVESSFLLPTTPNNTSDNIEPMLRMQRLENLVETLQARIDFMQDRMSTSIPLELARTVPKDTL